MDPGAKAGWRVEGVTGKATPSEVRRAESGDGVFGGGDSQPLPHQLGGLGERCELSQFGPGRSPGRQAVFLYFECSGWFLL